MQRDLRLMELLVKQRLLWTIVDRVGTDPRSDAAWYGVLQVDVRPRLPRDAMLAW